PALVVCPPGFQYLASFFACMFAGIIAAPLPVPNSKRDSVRFRMIVENSGARFAIAPRVVIDRLSRSGFDRSIVWIASDMEEQSNGSEWKDTSIDVHQVAYLQYTSGSTGVPRGVMLSHGNVLENLKCIHRVCGHSPESVAVSWLPHFHDMGLVYGILAPLHGGFPSILMPPSAFLRHP